MKKTVHVVPHTHWDREWYFTTSRSKVYLMHDLKNVLGQLEANNSYNTFILDGQASLLDDYLKWRPQDKGCIKNLVEQGKLVIGPWYTQTDQLVISGESIVRNLSYGMRICEKFGDYMNVGYVPDSFGQAASMPQIYQEFGIEDTMFWRGVSDDEVEHTEYQWQGEDGSVVNVYQIPTGYYIGGAIPEQKEDLAEFLHEEPFHTTWSRSVTDQVYFPNGFDQAPVRKNLPELVERMNELYQDEYQLQFSTIEKYIQAVKQQNPELEEVEGELLNGKMMRIHKSIFSSRSDLKAMNTQIQHYLVNILEPILSITQALGFEYPVETVREVWKLMFENAAHDSIGSCVSDMTNEDIYLRYKQARDISLNLVELSMRNIATRIKNTSEITFTIFNTLDHTRTEVIETEVYVPQKDFALYDAKGNPVDYTIIDWVDQTDYVLNQGNTLDPSKTFYIPDKVYKTRLAISGSDLSSMGYMQLTLDLKGNTLKDLEDKKNHILENEYYKVTINPNGSLEILDKTNQNIYHEQAIIEENGDDGDSFNYSPPKEDFVIRSTDFVPDIQVQCSELIKIAMVSYNMKVPRGLGERAKHEAHISMPVTLKITLKKGTSVIDFALDVDNQQVDSHRLCVLFDTGISSKFSIADQQFGVLQRPVVRQKELELWEQNPENWNEKPISIETCQSFAGLFDENHGVAVMPKGVREYEIVGDNYDTIRLTIFRTYGFMGKEDLLYRPGRASGDKVVETPNAQLHKKMQFNFSTAYFSEPFNEANVSNIAKAAVTPVQVFQYAEFLNSRLIFTLDDVEQQFAKGFSLFESTDHLTLSLVKKAEQRAGYIMRYYNGHLYESLPEKIFFNVPVQYAELVNLKEEKTKQLEIMDNTITIPNITHAKFVTIYVELDHQ
ncbi:mannosylglycerate hydrolase [Tetragenococcus koreensis]|uniref:Alpha-mannosidase n=1 Tax=Tetragenococcus koreensis TaxID=290335 RepID=A0AAN4UCS2_9ENTE|nr:mannosylglycerate hydrolase [Tetragenococcus koreensis]AYW46584.1 mannosylglycerate hydrolase [Tetragenococcus koreensis]MCF1585618.1 mannosylglycerate hydrolase [Tetragenococcus koreensis]MCF1615186.1 mannosylglycerate hydrolase [Tetragenococcus koreensis]MCF1617893.1 mannosylglycerate hydrolase [Tetragenococcus koreensis]MCF1620217.1 mannosylglycerate hydrolase [Tetragenococcus koreensis]